MSAGRRVGVLVMHYGTPTSPDDLERYYTDIRRGRPPTAEQLADLRRRYDAIGGSSPLQQISQRQLDVLAAALDATAPGRFVTALGTKHATPTIADAVQGLADAGVSDVIGLVLAPHNSSGSIGEYVQRAGSAAAAAGVTFDAIRSWATEPAFVSFLTRELEAIRPTMPSNAKVVFTAHSLPRRIVDSGDPYPHEVRATADAVASAAGLSRWAGWSLAWQSAGRTPEPWLGPDISTVIADLARTEDADGMIVCACGFVADHLEVLYDLDIEASRQAEQAGLAFARTASVNADPAVLGALAVRVIERSRQLDVVS